MRRRVILFLSLGLNLAFAAAVLIARRHHVPIIAGDTADASPAPVTNVLKPQVVVRKQFFTWRQVESADYRSYIANLREIGCPEQTIRDIIIADVNQLYAKKRATELAGADQEWWRSEPAPGVAQATRTRLEELEQERRSLLASLLGTDWESAPAAVTQSPPAVVLNGPVLGALSPEVRARVEEIVARAQEYLDSQKAAGKVVGPAESARLDQETRAELAKVLDPQQLEEYLLRYSKTASDLRKQLAGFPVTPDEFRNLFRAEDPLDQQIQLSYANDNPSAAQLRASLDKSRDDALKAVLGPERYRQYRIATDPSFRDALAAAQQAGASDASVTSLYAVNQATAQEIQRILNDPTLTTDQKAAQIKAAREQQKAATDEVLGLVPPPAPSPSAPVPAPPAPMATHAYSPGETLDGIADLYGVSPDALRTANPNVDFERLSKGTTIKIPAPPGSKP